MIRRPVVGAVARAGWRAAALVGALLAGASRAEAQRPSGAIVGSVSDAGLRTPVRGAVIEIVGTRLRSETDSNGVFVLAAVPDGTYRIDVRAIGFAPSRYAGVTVRAGGVTQLDVSLRAATVTVDSFVVAVSPDPVLDPRLLADAQHISAVDLRRLPVATLEEAVALSAGVVGESYRGGRAGQQAFVLDGLGVKNQLDASTGALGLRVPEEMLREAEVVTNAFSARYGQALSGLVNVVTRDGGGSWSGRAAYETDRPFGRALDLGLDRVVVTADGPLPAGARFVGVLDASGRLDAEPVNAPAPPEPLSRRAGNPAMLPHNGGEAYDLGAKLTIPFARRQTLRLFWLHSLDQRRLFDPAYTYDDDFAPVRRTQGDLATAHASFRLGGRGGRGVSLDLRGGLFTRDFVRGQLDGDLPRRFGAFTLSRLRVVGEEVARAQDTAAARLPIEGLSAPEDSERSPWGVAAFFLGGGSRGEVGWTRFRELRGQLDAVVPMGRSADLLLGGELVGQRVRTFQRVLGYLPVGGDVPAATASDFSPLMGALYGEIQANGEGLGLNIGVRLDRFDARADLGERRTRARTTASPRFAVSTSLRGATFVASWGRFAQAPDFQYLVDAAFDDTVRTGRFRRGNPDLGFEESSQFEFSLRVRPSPGTSVRLNLFHRRLEGLVASVPLGLDPDSTVFGNTDFGTVKGFEVLAEREFARGWGARVGYTLQWAMATATDAYQLLRRVKVLPGTTDTVFPPRIEVPLDYDRRHGLVAVLQAQVVEGAGPRIGGVRPLAGIEASVVARWSSGLPYSRVDSTGDSLVGMPNSYRLPAQSTVDLLVRRPLRVGRFPGSLYLDVRNLLGARNLVAVRRDSGEPGLGDAGILATAEAAWRAHPEDLPYESPRYRRWADLDGDGRVAGREELMPLFVAAARDYAQPLFAYGPPRLVRLGVELDF